MPVLDSVSSLAYGPPSVTGGGMLQAFSIKMEWHG